MELLYPSDRRTEEYESGGGVPAIEPGIGIFPDRRMDASGSEAVGKGTVWLPSGVLRDYPGTDPCS